MLKKLSIKTKLVLIILTYSLLANFVVGLAGWWNNRTTVEAATIQQLNTFRKTKADQIEKYFAGVEDQLWSLSQTDTVIEAAVRFNRAFRQLQTEQIPADWQASLETYYTTQFLRRLFELLPGDADYELYRPTGQAEQYLQYNYIVANPEDQDKRILLEQAEDGSEYSALHARFHPYFSQVLQRFALDDIKLVDIDSGDVVYTAAKEVDFGSNLLTGPYARSNLGAAIAAVQANPDRGSSLYVDYDFYRPIYGHPAAFVVAPVYNGTHAVAILVLQLSAAAIDQIMTNNQNWPAYGLGATGETYLVGADQLMRSNSRFLIEDPEGFIAALPASGLPERNISLIKRSRSSVLYQQVNTPTVLAALAGEEGIQFIKDYRGVPVLSSYQPIQGAGNRWALIAEVDEAEAFQPFYTVQNHLLILSVLLEILFAFSAIVIAYRVVKPIDTLVQRAEAVNGGDLNLELKPASHDEIGALTTSLAGIVTSLRQNQRQLGEQDQEIDRLLLNLLPALLLNPVRKGAPMLTEEGAQVTVLFASIEGMDVLEGEEHADRMIEFLRDLSNDLDEAADLHDIEKFLTGAGDAGVRLMALSGFSTPHLDHAQRAADFAMAVRRITAQLQTHYGIPLEVKIGMAAGPMTMGVVNGRRLLIEMWGAAPDLATALQTTAGKDMIVVSQQIYDRLHEFYVLERHANDTWQLIKPVAETLSSG